VLGRNSHRHARQLAVQNRDDLSNSLCCAGARWDDVGSSSTSTTPVLGRGAIDRLLGSCVRVDRGHKTLNDGVLVVDDLSKGSQAVSCAISIRDDLKVRDMSSR
jgi:hypothetical protein